MKISVVDITPSFMTEIFIQKNHLRNDSLLQMPKARINPSGIERIAFFPKGIGHRVLHQPSALLKLSSEVRFFRYMASPKVFELYPWGYFNLGKKKTSMLSIVLQESLECVCLFYRNCIKICKKNIVLSLL